MINYNSGEKPPNTLFCFYLTAFKLKYFDICKELYLNNKKNQMIKNFHIYCTYINQIDL